MTNQLQYLAKTDHIVMLKEGRIHEQGSFEELMAKGGSFADLMRQQGASAMSEEEEPKEPKEPIEEEKAEGKKAPETIQSQAAIEKKIDEREAKLIEKEEREHGSVRWAVYKV